MVEACKCCELANVFGAVGALAISIAAIVIYWQQEIPEGPHAAPLHALSSRLSWDLSLILLLNVLTAGVVCLSNFECPSLMKLSIVHCMTKASSLCCWCIVVWCSFLVQLAANTCGMVWFVMVDFIAFICHTDPQTVAKAQDVLYGLGNMTAPQGGQFHPFGVKHIKDTPIISLNAIAQQLNLSEFCSSGNSPHLDSLAMHFWLACLLTIVSQALMSVALNGEKERVAVHELHENASITAKLFGYA